MMNWLYYLLEANLYLAIFYGCYRLLFHKETFYTINRYFLIGSTLLAFILPVLQIGYLNHLFQGTGYDSGTMTELSGLTAVSDGQLLKSGISTLYILVALGFSLKLFGDLFQIIMLSRKTERHRDGQVIYVPIDQGTAAFSFFNLLFIQPDILEKETILKHEMIHIRQGHSIDILFFELVQILSWFNPISYLIKRDIKLLHEYIADELTTKEDIRKHDYALFLIRNSFGTSTKQLSNQIFNQSILKQRINMLNKEKSTGRARLKLLLALPLIGGMLCTSTMAFTKDYGLLDFYPEKVVITTIRPQDSVKKSARADQKKTRKWVHKTGFKAPPPPPPAPPVEPASSTKAPPPPPMEPSKTIKFGPPPPPPAKGQKSKENC